MGQNAQDAPPHTRGGIRLSRSQASGHFPAWPTALADLTPDDIDRQKPDDFFRITQIALEFLLPGPVVGLGVSLLICGGEALLESPDSLRLHLFALPGELELVSQPLGLRHIFDPVPPGTPLLPVRTLIFPADADQGIK